jgi:hypothetical protein
LRAVRLVSVRALGVPREAVIGDWFPRRRIGDELTGARSDTGIRIELAQPDAHATEVLGVTAEHCRAALIAKKLFETARRSPRSQMHRPLDDAKRPWRWACVRRSRGAGATLTSGAVAVIRGNQGFGHLKANRPAATAAGEGELGSVSALHRSC